MENFWTITNQVDDDFWGMDDGEQIAQDIDNWIWEDW